MKATLQLTGTSHADQDVLDSLASASRAIEDCCHRSFWLGVDANEERIYTPDSKHLVLIDDLETLTSVETDTAGDGSYATTLILDTDFYLEPANAELLLEPYTQLRAIGHWRRRRNHVRVTGRFGWPYVPAPIRDATRILATKLFKRKREAPFGIVTMGAEAGVLMRLTEYDPDVGPLIKKYVKPIPPA